MCLRWRVSFPGLIAYAINPNLDDPNKAYPFVVTTLLPRSLQGIVLAALVSAIMSTISALVNSTATVFTIDIYQRFIEPGVVYRRILIRVGRYTGDVVLLIGFLVRLPLVRSGSTSSRIARRSGRCLPDPTVAVL